MQLFERHIQNAAINKTNKAINISVRINEFKIMLINLFN